RPRRQPQPSPSSSASPAAKLGLVASLARPGGNLTGINFLNSELTAKRLELLRELVPAATRVAVLVNPTGGATGETAVRDAEAAARAMALQTQVLNASKTTSAWPITKLAPGARQRTRSCPGREGGIAKRRRPHGGDTANYATRSRISSDAPCQRRADALIAFQAAVSIAYRPPASSNPAFASPSLSLPSAQTGFGALPL